MSRLPTSDTSGLSIREKIDIIKSRQEHLSQNKKDRMMALLEEANLNDKMHQGTDGTRVLFRDIDNILLDKLLRIVQEINLQQRQ